MTLGGRGANRKPGAPMRAAAFVPWLAVCLATGVAAASDRALDEIAARAVARCESISPDQGQTAMIFNPRDRQTVWDRSECFQSLSAMLRDERYCELAIERKSRLFDGSGVSPVACRRALEARRAADSDEAARIRDPHRVVDASILRNGNGRDFDLRVQTEGRYAHGYMLRALIVGAGAATAIAEISQPLGASDATLAHFVPASRLRSAFEAGSSSAALSLRVELALAPATLDERAIFALLPSTVRESAVLRPLSEAAIAR